MQNLTHQFRPFGIWYLRIKISFAISSAASLIDRSGEVIREVKKNVNMVVSNNAIIPDK